MINLTEEQKAILEAVKRGEPLIKINAFAGTGKTTTLLEIAKALPNRKILYLAFNKSIQLEAQSKFPSNTIVKTTHSLAYGYFVLRGGYNPPRSNYRTREIAQYFMISPEMAKRVGEYFEAFCNGADKEFFIDPKASNDVVRAKEYARDLFNDMMAKKIDITHSFYLKAFQISLLNKSLRIRPYDLILLDEAQDTNDVTLAIFYALPANQKVIVGDRHQQIYSFRGSVNAMTKVKASIYHLTNSFRFNSNIADNATFFLNAFKGERKILKGLNNDTAKKITDKAYISRTNAKLIERISNLIDEGKFFKTIREPNAIFGLCLNLLNIIKKEEVEEQYKFLMYYYNDFENGNYEDNFLTFLQDKAEEVDDQELATAAKITNEYRGRIKFFYSVAKENFVSKKESDIYLTTAHTSKGLEWDEVEILDDFSVTRVIAKFYAELGYETGTMEDFLGDFSSLISKRDAIVSQEIVDELNLYYVAITRARKRVIDNSGLYEKIAKKNRRDINREINFFIDEMKDN